MSKQTRKDKKAEEKRIIAQFEEALQEERGEKVEEDQKPSSISAADTPEKIHCRRCKTLMEEGVCPVCGFKIYQPMSEEKRRKIKRIITVVALVVFAIFLVAGLIKG